MSDIQQNLMKWETMNAFPFLYEVVIVISIVSITCVIYHIKAQLIRG